MVFVGICVRKVLKYQSYNQKTLFKEKQYNGEKKKHKKTNYTTQKTKYWATQTPLKTGGKVCKLYLICLLTLYHNLFKNNIWTKYINIMVTDMVGNIRIYRLPLGGDKIFSTGLYHDSWAVCISWYCPPYQ